MGHGPFSYLLINANFIMALLEALRNGGEVHTIAQSQ